MKKITRNIILISIAIIFVLISSITVIVDYQWFKELGYLSIYFTKVLAIAKLMIPTFLVTFLAIILYYKSLKPNIKKLRREIEVDKLKEKRNFRILIIVDLLVSLIFSFIFSNRYWYNILEFSNSTKFSLNDPIFNKDLSFFLFKLPLIQSLYGSMFILLIILVIATFAIYIIFNVKDKFTNSFSNQIDMKSLKSMTSGLTNFAGKQLAILAALLMLMVSLGYMMQGWNLAYSPRGVVVGASYTDVTVSLKFYKVITIAALIGAIVVFFSVMSKKVKPIIASILIIVVLIIGETVTSGLVQQFIVHSNEKTLEKPYIERNIEYTKKAFNIDEIQQENFTIKNDLTAEDLTANKDIVNNIKVNSYRPALEFYNQFQYIRYYYKFNDIDMDRYYINGDYNQVFIAAREIDFDKLDNNSITWQNKHLAYTHGYGVVMSKVKSVTSEGQPDFVMSNIPLENKTDISLENPRIYFGEGTDNYSIVNTKLGEIDYPVGGENATNNYDGAAGIKMTPLNKLLFAIKEQNTKFILSQDITSESKILLNRNIMDRVKKIAPFLYYDKDPYVVISNNQLYWIVDAYTVTDKFPFAQSVKGINYIRNSVKVVIDAYNGTTDFYIVDKEDPIVNTYAKIFPKLFNKDVETLSEDIRSHFRYPQDLFNIQSYMLEKYHVSEPGVFYNGDDVWSVASDNYNETEKKEEVQTNSTLDKLSALGNKGEKSISEKRTEESSYVTMKLPNEEKEEMVILDYFNTKGRDNMVAMYGVRMDGNNYGKMFLYEFPTGGTVYNPTLFKKKINQDPEISKQLALWDTKGSQVQFGEVLIVPIKNSLLYVSPLYLRASGENSIPEMRNVVVGYGDKLVLSPNIETALSQLFNFKEEDNNGGTTQETPNNGGTIVTPDMIKISEAYKNAMEAQKNGDWAKYGEYINELGKLIDGLSK